MSKTRMGKRVASLLLSLVMMLSLLPTTVYAEGADTGDTTDEIVGQATTSGDNTEGTGEPEPTGEGEDGSANVTEGEDGAATNDAVVEETIAPVNAEGVDAVANAESSGDKVSGEDGNELVNFVTVNGDDTKYKTLDAAIEAATPDETGVITYNISGKVDVTATGWIQVANAGLAGLTAVKFVGKTVDAGICITGELAILADQNYDIDVSFESLTLSKPNPAYGGDYGHSTNYFTTWLRNTGAAENTVTYTDCTFPNGVCNNQYGKTVFDNCQFTNRTTRLYNLWVYGGNVELNGGTFTGTRGAKVYTEGDTQAKTPMTVDIKGTSFEGLTEKAAIVVSKAAAVTLTNVSATDCNKGLFQKAIEGSSNEEEVVIAPSGTNVSGTFEVDGNMGVGEADKRNFNISAGTFTSKVSNDYCADGFEIKASTDASGNTTYGVEKAATAVAKIGETTYETLAEAIAAANAGDTVTLLTDVTENVEIAKERNLTLDLNGKTLNGGTSTAKAALTNYGTITIRDTSAAKTGTIKRDDNGTVGETSYYVIDNHGTMTIEGGNVINNSGYRQTSSIGSMNGSSLIRNGENDGGATLNITGGKLEQQNFIAIKNSALGTLHVTGGTITSKHSAIQNWFEATITGGEINGQLWTDAWKEGESVGKTTIGGDATFTGEIVMDITGSMVPTLAINGGNLDVTNWRITKAAADAGAKPAVSGGTFKAAVPENYCADGFIPTKNADGSYGVKTGAYVAQIGDVKYETLKDAINAANTGNTIVLLVDVNLTSAQAIRKQLTIDLNGKTISSTAYRTIQLNAGADLTVKDSASVGKITNTYTGSAYPSTIYLNGAGAKFTLESGTIESDPNKTNLQSVAINSEKDKACEVNIRGGSVTVPEAATQGRAIVASTNSMTLNISGGTIAGGLHGVDAYSGSNVTITGGEITARYVDTGVIKEAYGMRLIGTANVTVAGGTITGVKMDDNGSKLNVPAVKLKSGTINGSFYSISKGTIIFDVAENADIVLENDSAEQFLPDTVELVRNKDGTYGIKAGTYVAQIGETTYATLEAAIAAAKPGATITLLVDLDLSATGLTIAANKDVTLDLNGKTLKLANTNSGNIKVFGKLTLQDITDTAKNGTGTGKVWTETSYIPGEQDKVLIAAIDGGTFIMESGLIDAASFTTDNGNDGQFAVSVQNENADATVIINGGCIKAGWYAIAGNGQDIKYNGNITVNGGILESTADYAIYHPHSGTTTINGGVVFGAAGGVSLNRGKLIVNNGIITSKGTGTTGDWGDGTGNQNAAAINVNAQYGSTSVEIKGGKITAEKDAILLTNGKDGTIKVSGGTFNSAVMPEYCAAGYIPTKNEDGSYGVKEGSYVAETNNVKYESLQAAIDAASRKATVKLLADTRENVTISTPYLTLDLNGFTLNGSTGERKPALTITARVTVMDSSEAKTGTIMRDDTAENSGVSSHYVIDVQGDGWLTFESGNVKNGSGAGGTKGASLVRVGSDSVAKYPGLNIKGGTFTQDNFIVIKVERGDLFLNGGSLNSAKSYAVQTWHRATIKGGTVNGAVSSWTYDGGPGAETTISGGTVNGNVEAISYDGKAGKPALVSISGGTVNGTLIAGIYNSATEPTKDIATIEVTGGTFKKDPTKYLVECSTVNTNTDGTFGVKKAYLAKVGNTSYYTMDEAFKAQTASGADIVMLRDYTTGSTFNSGTVARVVDLGGYTWTCTGTDANSAAFEINNSNVTLTVKNGTVVSSQLVGLIPSAMGGTITYDNSSLTFENVEMSTTATSGIETNGNNTNDTVTLKNSTLNVPNGFGIYFPSSGKLTIDNSKINAKTMGVQVCAGSLSINAGSTITVTGDAVLKTENDGAIQDGAAISIVNRGYKPFGEIAITGGTFESKVAAIKAYDWDNTNKVEKTFTANEKVAVSGGSFSSAVPEGLCAEGYIPTKNEGGTYGVKEGTYVAEYNGTKYTSLQEAIDAASHRNGGQTEVKLLCDLTITETVNFAKEYGGSVLLNLGGYTLTGEGCRALQINKGNLYLENGTVTSTGIINSSSVIRIGSNEEDYSGVSPLLYMRNGAKVLAPDSYGVTIFGSKTVKEKLTVAGNASIEATGPSPAISGNGDKAYHVDGKGTEITITGNAVVSATNNYAIYHPDNGTLKIQDNASVIGKGGIQMCSGTLTISGSPKIEALGKADHETGAAGPIYDVAAISVVNRSYPGGAPVVTITGTPTVTTVDGEVIHAYTWSSNAESDWAEAGDNINVSGGTYSKAFNEAYLAADCTLVSSDGVYTVEQKKVAEYNSTQYTSLSQAILDANKSGVKATVKLLDNVTLTNSLGIGGAAAVTLDLSKKTLTLDGAQIYTQGSATVTINNGTIKRFDTPTSGSANNFAIQVMSGSSLILGAGTSSTYKVTLESTYGIYNVGGTLTVRYATINTDGWSIAVSDSASTTGEVYIGRGMGSNTKTVITSKSGNVLGTMVNSKPNVTIDYGTLTSNGTTWDAGVVYWASEGTLTITGGIFNASSVEGSKAAAVYQKNGTVKISGTTAKLLGSTALVVQAGEGSTGTMVTELSGGTYSTKPDEAWVVEGKEIHEVDGLYKVEGPYVVEVTHADGTVHKFDSWSKAFYSAEAQAHNATVKLLTDIETTSTVTTWATVTVDFNGHTLTVNGSGVAAITALTKGTAANVTLMDSVGNGGMKTTGVYGVTVRGTGATATVKSGSYNCNTSVVQVENGTAYIEGGTFQTKDTDKSYLLNCIDAAFTAGTANIEVTGGTFNGFDPSANPEGEGTTYVKAGYVSTNNGDGTYTVEEYKPVEVWTGYTGTKVASYATIGEAVANLGDNKWIVITKNYTLTEDFTISNGVYLDVTKDATLTVAKDVTLTVAANAKRLGVREDATVVNNGTILVCGSSTKNGFAMLYGTFIGNELTVPTGCFLDNNNKNFFATANENAVYEITFGDGTVKKTADSTNIEGGNVKQIKLLQNVTKGGWTLDSRSVGPEVVLDLNGHELSYDGANRYYATLNVYTKVTIKNGTVKYEGSERGAIDLVGQGDLTIESDVTINGGNAFAIFTSGTSKLTVNGIVETNGNYAIAGNGSKDAGGYIDSCNITVNEGAAISAPNGVAIYHPEKGTVTINGGTITGHTGVQMCSGELSINAGSTITVTGDAVPKTENDGGILDGAAVSIINRSYPGGTPTATIAGGTFTSANGIVAVQAYTVSGTTASEWTDVAKYVNISGGTFSSIPDNMAALCKVGYRAVEDNNVYIVKEGKYVIEVTSRIQDTNQTVATPTGGGQADYGEEVTVTTYAVTGFTFLGWYDSEGNQLSTKDDMTYTHKVTGDCTLIAKYTAVSGGTFRLEVNASKFIVDGKTKMRYVDMRINAATEVVVEYTGTDKFLYWINGSNNVVSTEAKITLVAVGNFKLTAVVESTELGNDYAYVIFKNAFVKGQSLSVDYYTSSDTIVFPSTPVYVGRTFKYWGTEVNGEIVEATQAVISGLIKDGAKTVIIAPVYESNGTYTVTVNYVDAVGNPLKGALTKSGIGTGLMEYVTADEKLGELIFSHWEIGGKNVGTNKTYAVLSRTDGDVVELTAVYVTEGTVTKPENVLTIAATGATIEGGKYAITFTANYSIGEAAAIAQGGILYWNAELSEDEFTVANSQLRKINWDKLTENFGACDGTVKNTTASVTIYARAYIVLENGTTIYSDIVHASYNDIAGK